MMEQSELDFILDVDKWPRWPFLPMKKLGTNRVGVLCQTSLAKDFFSFAEVNLFIINTVLPVNDHPDVWKETHPSELVADGWVGD